MQFGEGTIRVLDKSLSSLWQRQRVINENITNLATPGYKRQTVRFEEQLEKEVKELNRSRRSPRRVEATLNRVEAKVVRDNSTAVNEDGNNVDVDLEFTELLRTELQYQYAQRLLNDELSRLRYAITEGRG